MISTKKMENIIGLLLTIGMLFSAILVLIGGVLYLLQHGSDPMQTEVISSNAYQISIKHLWHRPQTFSAITIIELGLLALVATQILRVGLLAWFYTAIKDSKFALISFFILLMLIYSFVWRS